MGHSRDLAFTRLAEADIGVILDQSVERFEIQGRRRYEALIATALRDLQTSPTRPSSRTRLELGPRPRSYHLRNSRDRAPTTDGVVGELRHLVVYRIASDDLILILRVLHDAMELTRHLSGEDEADAMKT